jgi:nicotinamidase-related amidase
MHGERSPVLFVIDMQEGFLNAHSKHVVPTVVGLVSHFQQRNLPIIFTKYINYPGSQFERLLDFTDVSSAPETDIVFELVSNKQNEITKHSYTAITVEAREMIASYEWNEVIICGVSTESCVLKTAVDVFEEDLRPIVISDACASNMSVQHHQAGLLVIETMIGSRQILTADQLVKINSLN